MKISGKIFLVYYSGEQFVNDLLTGLFFPYRNLCALLPVPLRVFLGETIKNPDNHLGISSFLPPHIASFFPFLSKKKVLFLLAVFCILLFVSLSAPILYYPPPQELVGLPPSLLHCECHYPRDIRKISRCKQKHKSLCFSAPSFFSSVLYLPHPPPAS